jgi:nitrous oxidase accessory protein
LKTKAFGLVAGIALAALTLTPGRESGATPSALQSMIDAAQPGATVFVPHGTYLGSVVIDKPLSLVGVDHPVIDGGGEGDVVTISAESVSMSGFEVRGSGRAVSQDPAAIKVENANAVTLRSNRVRDSMYGIFVTGTHHAQVAYNDVDLGRTTPIERRGHGIYFWNVGDSSALSNAVSHAADGVHLEFSDGNVIRENRVENSRYALHFMSSDGNSIVGNTLDHNLAGAVLMFSSDLVVKDNDLSNNRRGASGAGMLLKDVDSIFAEGNRLLRNKYAITAEGTPQSQGSSAVFMRNLLALNDTGVALMSNAPVTFVENAMIENTVQVRSLGGNIGGLPIEGHLATGDVPTPAPAGGHGDHGAPAQDGADAGARPGSAVWTIGGRGNYWSDYSGYDAAGDGIGDTPYAPQPPFFGALSDDDSLRLFQFTIAQEAIDAAADMFPLYEYDAVIQDSGPLMQPPGPALQKESRLNGELLVISLLLLLLAGAVLQAVLDFDASRVFANAVRRLPGVQGGH